MAETCEHQQRNPEGAEWSDNDSLAHFLHCKTEQQQADWWAVNREAANAGYSCRMGNHLRQLEAAQQHRISRSVQVAALQQIRRTDQAYIASMVTQLRELIREGSWDADYLRERLVGVLTTTAQSIEQVDP